MVSPICSIYSRPLSTIWLSEKFHKFEGKKYRKTVARRHAVGGIAQSPHEHRAKADPRTGSVRFPCRGCGDCTATALTLHIFRTISAQSLYGFTPGCPRNPVIEEMARWPSIIRSSHSPRTRFIF